MPSPHTPQTTHDHVLVIGASRGLGEAIAQTYAERGAHVVATVRRADTPLHQYVERTGARIEIEYVDIDLPEHLTALRDRLGARRFDLLFVVAGVSLAAQDAVGADISTADFSQMMLTNVLGVMRAVETLQEVVTADGTIAVMSSGQGSVADNTTGGFEVYRATKSALNQMFRSYAARRASDKRPLLLMAPGWVKTGLGGPNAMLEISDSIPALVDTVDAQHATPGLQYLDRKGQPVAW